MSAGTPSLVIIGAFLAGAGLGWIGRSQWDGSIVSAPDAQKSTQAAVNQSAKAANKIERATFVADAARHAASKSIEVSNVDRTCPPGLGPVSDDAAKQLRAAFGTQAGSAADPS